MPLAKRKESDNLKSAETTMKREIESPGLREHSQEEPASPLRCKGIDIDDEPFSPIRPMVTQSIRFHQSKAAS